MSIIFSAIVPHPPILVSTIGKENTKRLKATIASYQKLENDLYAAQIDTLLIISPHGQLQSDSFVMNLSPEYNINFEEFGDFSTKSKINGDIGLGYKIRESMETKMPLQLITETNLDYGSAIPVYFLTKHLPQLKIIPIHYSGLDLNSHYNFGQLLKHELLINKNRVVVIASGDLSHCLTKNSPAGYNVNGKKFDEKLIEYLKQNKIKKILSLDQEFISSASECGLKSIVILLGILNDIKYQTQLLSYEAPFGVGYLTMSFKL
ncbi:MAG: AmmeMemoRadiSam system protein B [Patescibacteria group bacterium]|nr:AmmeMemoRadiSam system protein B [Patescibacteria group bacterium]MBU1870576.1 AmmeMemoRadiSam system protein B [Patescibacteria group bacterium]